MPRTEFEDDLRFWMSSRKFRRTSWSETVNSGLMIMESMYMIPRSVAEDVEAAQIKPKAGRKVANPIWDLWG